MRGAFPCLSSQQTRLAEVSGRDVEACNISSMVPTRIRVSLSPRRYVCWRLVLRLLAHGRAFESAWKANSPFQHTPWGSAYLSLFALTAVDLSGASSCSARDNAACVHGPVPAAGTASPWQSEASRLTEASMHRCVVCGGALPARRRRYCNELCATRGDAEVQRVKWHTNASLALGLSATLDIDVWFAHLRHFEWRCAYCQERPATDIDHFIPPGYMGGTTAGNSVPCCAECTIAKSGYHPDMMPFYPEPPIPSEALARVRSYLLRFAS